MREVKAKHVLVQMLVGESRKCLALVIQLFSVIFPFAKLLVLMVIWFVPFDTARRQSLLGAMGRLSMLDVFMVAMVVVIGNSSKSMKYDPHYGFYVFSISIILSMVITMYVDRLARKARGRGDKRRTT